ncbi:VOC family protein [Bacillus alkalicellulosilyticus]|uniref:VOC family protein n=1 Tax=Alkalihalobacterium alkalicellulosilyticum TaxID=1912214 RepID=UPI000997A92B|nr:VOC family protein [Bacillus alkalicellulosilyticus]
MNSPIKNKINTIFVHVSNLEESVKWYSRLLNHDVDLSNVSEPVHNIPMNQYTGLTLDAGPSGVPKKITPSSHPLFNFHTDNIQKSYEYLRKLGYQIESEIVKFDDFAYFNISDPDNNIIMVCNG